MSIIYFASLLNIIISASAAQFQPLLQLISSGTGYCNNENMFKHFDLSEVTQFGAMCNIPVPDKKQVEFLLDNNIVPVLCMGLYDVSERLCKSALEDSLPFPDIFPASSDKFQTLFKTLAENDEYSLLDIFCSRTTTNYTVSTAVSNVTEFWWEVLNNQFNNESKCRSTCRTYENNKVHPLCSFIIWAIGIYKNRQKNKLESQVTATVSGGDVMSVDNNLNMKSMLPGAEAELYRPMLSNFDTQSAFQPAKIDIVSTLSTITVQRPLPPSSDVADEKLPKISSIDLSAQKTIQESMTAEKAAPLIQNKSAEIQLTSKTFETNPPVTSPIGNFVANKAQNKLYDVKVTKTNKPKKKYLKKRPIMKTTTHYPLENGDVNQKTVISSIDTVINETMSDGQAKPKTDLYVGKANIKVNDLAMVEGDFSFEPTQEAIGLDQPIAVDKDVQPPYPGEEDGGDGDDVILPDEMIKSDPNKTNSVKVGSGPLSDQGGEPDKVYSDGEVEREIMIEDHFIEAEDSHFFSYFLFMAVLTILVYLAFHNKKKLLALAVEGRRSKGSRRRPNCSNYSKLDCSLEEALTSNTTASVTHVLY